MKTATPTMQSKLTDLIEPRNKPTTSKEFAASARRNAGLDISEFQVGVKPSTIALATDDELLGWRQRPK